MTVHSREPTREGAREGAREAVGDRLGRRLVRMGLAARLFLATGLVIVVGAATLLAVALVAAPALFYDHLRQAHLPAITPEVRAHVDDAFVSALVLALVGGVIAATLAAVVVTWLVARRLATPVQEIAAATQRLADGHYDTVVTDPRLGPEFATLATSVTRLARRLADADATRHRLTSDLAHQLRTPLASLEATVEAIGDGVLEPDAQTLAVLADQTGRLRRLVADLEKVSRAEERHLALDTDPGQLGPLVAMWVAGFEDEYRAAGVDLCVDVEPDVPDVRVDRDRLAEAVGNLLDNALRHTSPGGTVAVHVGRSRVGDGAPAGGVLVTVADTGSGFPADQAEELFRRFYRGVGADGPGGSGLGLTIARALVEAHGGALTARSDGPGRGACFTIILPPASTR